MMASQPHSAEPASVMDVDFGSRQVPPSREPVPEVGANAAQEVRGASLSGAEVYPPAAASEPPARKRWLGLLLGVLALAAFVAVVWFAYDRGLSSAYREEVPTIRADSGPIKVKPDNPGGLVVPNQDKLVLNQPGQSGEEPVERLLSEPEAPQPPEPLVAPEPSGPLVTIAPETAEGQPEAGLAPEAAPEAVPDAAPDAAGEPDPAADIVEQTLAALAQRAAEQDALDAAQLAADGGGASGATSGSASGASSGNAGSPAGGDGGAASSPTATQLVAVEKGDYVIQLASVTSADAAQGEWGRLQRAHPSLLGDMTLSVQQATVNGTLYHRVQTGPFPSRATAQDLCAQLKSLKQACIVQRR